MSDSPVLVLGGTGHYGRKIVAALARRGRRVRVLSRSATAARRTLGEGVDVVEGDLTVPATLPDALAGVERAVIAVSAFTPALVRRQRDIERDGVLAFLEAGRRAGLARVVYLRGYEPVPALIEALDFQSGRIMMEVEAALKASAFDWTICGEAPSFDVFLATLSGDRMRFPGDPPPFPSVSADDVGEIVAQAVLRDDLGGRIFRVTGPEALSMRDAAARIARVTGRPVAFSPLPLLPLRLVAFLLRPFFPYAHHVVTAARMLNLFPADLSARVPEDHRLLRETFDYTPVTFDEEVRARFAGAA